MDKKTEALKLALEALKELRMLGMNMQWHDSWLAKSETAIAAIREALADSALDRMAENARELGIQMQPEQKPIARLQWADGWTVTLLTGAEDIPSRSGPYALYVGPAPEQPAQQQEPVAYIKTWHKNGEQHADIWQWEVGIEALKDGNHYLYTSPPASKPWVGLTDEDIDQGLLRSDYAFKTAEAWRAGVVFAMTKLKEKNNG